MTNTINIWIDLGTTNSAVVISHNWKFEVIKNSDQMDYTPSVFWYNKWKNIQVWKKAYEQLFQFSDEENVKNYKAEVKRLMWTNDKTMFDRVKQDMLPEEISSEIIKYLKESIIRKYPEITTTWVVITVPAYFDIIQKEATKKAWELAWFKHIILIQEPIAGAIAYWFDNHKNENRLVYDLWWGTFDVAVVSSKDWVLTIKWHAGDNYLGGKDFDNLIVDQLIVPKLKEKFSFVNLDKNKDKTIFNILKYYAESAKKELTDSSNIKVVIDNKLIVDEDWKEIYLEIDITRDQFETVISNLINKSIQLSQNAIKDSGLSNKDIAKIILIWWPTQIPYIRQKLESELEIKVDSSMDPLTVVAKWACIFWASQIIPEEYNGNNKKEKLWTVKIKLNYEPVVSDSDTTITGIIEELVNWEDYFIQIQSDDWKYSSSKIKLKNGKFFDTLLVSEGKSNTYFIYLTDNNGNIISTDIDSFTITHWLSIAWTPLSHSVSVALNKKTFLWDNMEEYCEIIFERWAILPLKKTLTYRTTRNLKKWDNENTLPIKIYEWESKKTDRNKQICQVKVLGTEVPYNLPEGTEVNLTIEIDISNELFVSVYFPSIDLSKSGKSLRTEWEQEIIDTKTMREDIEKENSRLDNLSEHIPEHLKEELRNMIKELYAQMNDKDADTQRKTHHQIKELKQKMDKHELETESSRLIKQFNEEVEKTEEIFNANDNPLEFKQFSSLKEDWEIAITKKDWERLENINDAISSLRSISVLNTPEWMKYILWLLYEKRHESNDPIKSNEIFNRCLKYVEQNDIQGMRQCIKELISLMPEDVQTNLWNVSWITK